MTADRADHRPEDQGPVEPESGAADTPPSPRRPRLRAVEKASGVAITLVVIGHVVAGEPPAGNEWYVLLKHAIYQFHMPLFLFLSGVVFYYTYTPVTGAADYWSWAKRKSWRLAPAFLVFGSIIILGKYVASQFVKIDDPPASLLSEFVDMLFRPLVGAAGSLWYVYVLLEFFLFFPLLLALVRQSIWAVVWITAAMHMLGVVVALPQLFMIDSFFEYAIYFALGGVVCRNYAPILSFLKRYVLVFLAVWAASFGLMWVLPFAWSKTVIGLLSIPAVLGLVEHVAGSGQRFLVFLSGYTFTIYLMNTIAIGGTKAVMQQVIPWDGANFFLYFFVLLAAGMFLPILAHKWVLSRNATISRHTR